MKAHESGSDVCSDAGCVRLFIFEEPDQGRSASLVILDPLFSFARRARIPFRVVSDGCSLNSDECVRLSSGECTRPGEGNESEHRKHDDCSRLRRLRWPCASVRNGGDYFVFQFQLADPHPPSTGLAGEVLSEKQDTCVTRTLALSRRFARFLLGQGTASHFVSFLSART
jgi:hypothetical protein